MKIKKSREVYFGLTFLATGKETDGKYFLSETTVTSGDPSPPVHTHSKEDEDFYLRSGTLTLVVDGEEIKLNEGEYLNIEKGGKHTWRNESNLDAELIVTFVPDGIEDMYKELDRNMANVKEIGQKYGTEFQV